MTCALFRGPSPWACACLAEFSTQTRAILEKFDRDKDGKLSVHELTAVVDSLVHSRFESRTFQWGIGVMAVFTVLLLGAMFGLTWAVIYAHKESKVRLHGVGSHWESHAVVAAGGFRVQGSGARACAYKHRWRALHPPPFQRAPPPQMRAGMRPRRCWGRQQAP